MNRSLLRGPLSLWQQTPSFQESSAADWTSGCGDGEMKRGGGGEQERKRLNKGVKARQQGEMKRSL